MKRNTSTTSAGFLFTTMVLCVFAAAASADSVKINGFWFDNVRIQDIANGNITFTVEGAERIQSLEKLEGIKATAYPDLTAATESLEKKDEATALDKFSNVAAKARDPWARTWAQWNKVNLLDKNGEPVDAVEAWLQLARSTEDTIFLTQPPVAAMGRATNDEKRDIAKRLTNVRRSIGRGPAKDQYKQLVALAKQLGDPEEPDDEEDDKPAATGMTTTTVTPKPATTPKPTPAATPTIGAATGATGPIESVVPLPSSIDARDEITRMLAAGNFAEALTELNDRLNRREQQMAMRIFQRGIARFYLAEKSGDLDQYKDAGVDFMRVAIYYPRSLYKGAALMEAGAVHDKIGKRDVAMQLWQKARVEIDPETETTLVQRLDKLMGVGGSEDSTPSQ